MNNQSTNHTITLWTKEHWAILTALGSIALIALGAAGYWGYVTQYRLPDLDKQMEEIKKSEASRWVANERNQAEQFARVNSILTIIKVNMITLMQQSGKRPTENQLKELLSSVQNNATTSAELVADAKVSRGTREDLPSISGWQKLNVAAGMPTGASVLYSIGKTTDSSQPNVSAISSEDVPKVLTLLLVSDSVRWETSNGNIKASYDNGAVTFTPKKRQDQSELMFWVNDANTLHSSLQSITSAISNLDKVKRKDASGQ
jgi:hypothetical protein